jgi:hypothetical protein
MDYLTKLSEQELKTILHFTEKLVEKQTVNGEIDFNSPDLEQADEQAKHFVERRKRGYRNSEIEGNAEIRTGIKDWMRRTNRYIKR